MGERYQIVINREQMAAVILFAQDNLLDNFDVTSGEEAKRYIHAVGCLQSFLETAWKETGSNQIKVEFDEPVFNHHEKLSSRVEKAIKNLDYRPIESND